MEASVVLIRCRNQNNTYGVRIQKMEDGDWWRTWAFKIDSRHAQNEGYDLCNSQGNLYYTKEYPGCPYCGSMKFVQCNKCHKLTCYRGEQKLICLWCENIMDNIVTATEKFTVSGGDV